MAMDPIKTLIFLVIVSNAGGEGKTLLARLMKALWRLLGQPVHLFDGDPGNRAAKVDDSSAGTLSWGVQAMRADDIVAATAGQHVILDLGANTLASAREIVDLLPALQASYEAAGYRTVAFMPVSTNKTGAVDAIEALAPNLHGFDKLFVRVNRDGSGTYDANLSSSDVIEVGHLQPGFQTYVRQVAGSFADAITAPRSGYALAGVYIADWMHAFAAQGPVRSIIGEVPALTAIDSPPGVLRFGVARLSETSDAALTTNLHNSRILNAISKAGWTAEGLRTVAASIDAGML
jgi:hypothetical protein